MIIVIVIIWFFFGRAGTGSCKDCVPGQYQDKAAQVNPTIILGNAKVIMMLQDQCEECPPGTVSSTANSSICSPCPVGTIQRYAGMAFCERCSHFQFTQDIGSTACYSCAAAACNLTVGGICGNGCGLNFYWDEEAAIMQQKQQPSSSSLSYDSFCTRCPPAFLNAFQPCARDISACLRPPPGMYAVPQAAVAGDLILNCPNGMGANTTWRSQCIPCQPGTYAVNGSGCLPCAGGSFVASAGATSCSDCASGSYTPPQINQQLMGYSYCIGCPAGKFAPANASSDCLPCPAATYASASGQSRCTRCKAGTWASTNNTTPLGGAVTGCTRQCNSSMGLYSGEGATACVYCAGGLTNPDGSLCTGCPLGTFKSPTTMQCIQCPLGLVNINTTYASDISVCVPCTSSIQYASLDATLCIDARPGYIPFLFDVYTTTIALRGSFNDTAACQQGTYREATMAACFPCPAGTWSVNAGQSFCTRCPPGTQRKTSTIDLVGCVGCPSGTISNTDLNGSSVECVVCPPGTDSDKGSTVCSPCPSNTYHPTTGGGGIMGCQPCPLDQVSLPGATSCQYCQNWTVATSGSGCSLCPPGTYTVVAYDTVYACQSCPPGTYSALLGAKDVSSCQACLKDKGYVPNRLQSGCIRCPAGQGSTQDGSACEDCGPGTYGSHQQEGGVRGCMPCAIGSASAQYGRLDSSCDPCPPGHYADQVGLSSCDACPAGKFSDSGSSTACITCNRSTFASSEGSNKCTPRTMQCMQGQYIHVMSAYPDQDNTCVDCQPCQSNSITVTTTSSTWTSLVFDSASGNVVPPSSCPGNTTSMGYRCVSDVWPAGQYLSMQELAGVSPYPSDTFFDGASTLKAVACPPLVQSAASLMDYVVGPTFECYVGCKYGLNIQQVSSYIEAYPDTRKLENPYNNVFYAQAKAYALLLCTVCPLTVCPYGKYRPLVAADTTMMTTNKSCGAPCLMDQYKNLCSTPSAGGSNQGCFGQCLPAPPNAVTTGGSAELDSHICPWVCLPGWHITEDGTGCSACADSLALCDAGYASVPPSMCVPSSTKSTLCKPCPYMEGGTPKAWLADTPLVGEGGGYCIYSCVWGYYAVDGGRQCLPCTGLNNISCPVGTFRDIHLCLTTGSSPPCSPCSVPAHLSPSIISFTTAGTPVGTDNCSASCNAGYHTTVAGVTAQQQLQYLADGQQSVSVFGISCLVCSFSDTVPCHGQCPPGYYRNGQQCKPCQTNAACGTGFYAPTCLGNGTADVGCMPCPQSLLLLPLEGTLQVREFVPYSYLEWSPAIAGGLIYADASFHGYACPTACIANYVLDPTTTTAATSTSSASASTAAAATEPPPRCISCKEYVQNAGCEAETQPATYYDAGQPKPCDFIYGYWNATPASPWWQQPKYTPSFLAQSIKAPAFYRNGLCWACPAGLGFAAGDADLCSLLPGFGETTGADQQVQQQRAPIPSSGTDVYISMQEPRPSLTPSWLSMLDPYEGYLSNNGHRRLLTLSNAAAASNSSSLSSLSSSSMSLALLAAPASNATLILQCDIGYYNDKTLKRCAICPAGTSTYATGSSSIADCKCYPGYYRLLDTAGGCLPCPADTKQADGNHKQCVPCPIQETTYDKVAQTACACKPGYRRLQKGGCVPCKANTFCTPCWDTQEDCPMDGVNQYDCFQNGVSPEGSFSLANCTCASGMATILRPGANQALLSSYYCLRSPPNTVYDSVLKRISCKKGWNSTWITVDGTQQLQACTLCPKGHYYLLSAGTCLPCPKGTYSGVQDGISLASCTPCPAPLTMTPTEASTSVADCGCPPPLVRDPAFPNQKKCKQCAPYEFPSSSGTCTSCPPNSILASGSCLCNAGFQRLVGASACQPCPKGTYSAHASDASCASCPKGSTTEGTGAKSIISCGVCLDGYTFAGAGFCRPSSILALT